MPTLQDTSLDKILENLYTNFDGIKQAGVADINLTVTLAYTAQCNWEFSPEQMRLLSAMNISLGVSCYESEE
jgi:hypothetical protein